MAAVSLMGQSAPNHGDGCAELGHSVGSSFGGLAASGLPGLSSRVQATVGSTVGDHGELANPLEQLRVPSLESGRGMGAGSPIGDVGALQGCFGGMGGSQFVDLGPFQAANTDGVPEVSRASTFGLNGGGTGELHNPLVVSPVRVAPVGLGAPRGHPDGLALAGNPGAVLLARNAVQPKFTGAQADWVTFRHDWERYVRQVGGRESMTDAQLLSTLETTLDVANQLCCQRRIKSGEVKTFDQFWGELVLEYEGTQGVGNREAWEAHRLNYEGELTSQVFKGYWERFLVLKDMVPGVTEDETYRLLLRALPPKERERVVGEQNRVLARRRRYILQGFPDFDEGRMRSWLQGVNVVAQRVKIVPGGFEVDPQTEQGGQVLMKFHGEKFERVDARATVKVKPVPERLEAEEVADLVKGWLRERAQANDFGRGAAHSSVGQRANWTPERRTNPPHGLIGRLNTAKGR